MGWINDSNCLCSDLAAVLSRHSEGDNYETVPMIPCEGFDWIVLNALLQQKELGEKSCHVKTLSGGNLISSYWGLREMSQALKGLPYKLKPTGHRQIPPSP